MTLRHHPELLEKTALWFSAKWDVPIGAYRESIESSFDLKRVVPQWYVILNTKGEIMAGAGVIDNDFHERKDLSPNICALFVEELYRNQHLAKTILTFIRKDFGKMGFEKLYLVTDHTQFYEKYDWQFLTMVENLEGVQERLYTVIIL
ncbi:TPA: GNAT family N-acetyltransferase [Streptococcus suis]